MDYHQRAHKLAEEVSKERREALKALRKELDAQFKDLDKDNDPASPEENWDEELVTEHDSKED